MIKLAEAWAFIAAHVVPAVVLGALVLFGISRVQSCGDSKQGEKAAVMEERLRLDSLVHVTDSIALSNANARLDTALRQGTVVVDRWRTVREPLSLPPQATPHDSVVALKGRLAACFNAGDSLVQSVVKLQTSCSAFRDTATKTIADQRTAYARLDSLWKIGKPPKRLGLGFFIGYGLRSDSSFAIRRGWVAGVGLSYSLIRF